MKKEYILMDGGRITGISIKEQSKTIVNCPLLFTFLRPFTSDAEEIWDDAVDCLAKPLLQKVKSGMDNDRFFTEFQKRPVVMWSTGIFRRDIRGSLLKTCCERLFLIGSEIASVKDAYALEELFADRFIELGLVNPDLLLKSGGYEQLRDNLMESVLAGARYRESLMGIDPLARFREVEDILS